MISRQKIVEKSGCSIRMNDLVREMGVKSKRILIVLPFVGITEKKKHSGSVDDLEAEGAAYLRAHPEKSPVSVSVRPQADTSRTAVNLSHDTTSYCVAAIRSGMRFAALGVPNPVTASQPGDAE